MATLLRAIASTLTIVGVVATVACTSASTPSPTSVLAKPTAAPVESTATPSSSKPAATSAPVNKPAGTPAAKSTEGQATKPSASANWQAEWDNTVAAAKKEGKVVVAAGRGELYQRAMTTFVKTYPEIKLEFTGFTGPDFAPKLVSEREAGQYLWDVWLAGWSTPVPLKNKGVLDPLRPALILPEVLDDSKWFGGFDQGWVDRERQYQFSFSAYLNFLAYVNTSIVPESEMKTADMLLDPKWKGKIAMIDPRVNGAASTRTGYLMVLRGEDWVRKLLSQDVVIMSESRQLAEAVVRGRYPIALGLNIADFESFAQEGLMSNIKPLAPDTPEGKRVNSGFGNATLINKAPHPNAAKVFINWLLSKDGQKSYVDTTAVNSRRLDVPQLPGRAPDPNAKYEVPEKEDSPLLKATERAIEVAKEIIK